MWLFGLGTPGLQQNTWPKNHFGIPLTLGNLVHTGETLAQIAGPSCRAVCVVRVALGCFLVCFCGSATSVFSHMRAATGLRRMACTTYFRLPGRAFGAPPTQSSSGSYFKIRPVPGRRSSMFGAPTAPSLSKTHWTRFLGATFCSGCRGRRGPWGPQRSTIFRLGPDITI